MPPPSGTSGALEMEILSRGTIPIQVSVKICPELKVESVAGREERW